MYICIVPSYITAFVIVNAYSPPLILLYMIFCSDFFGTNTKLFLGEVLLQLPVVGRLKL